MTARRYTVATLKGGPGKTTTAWHLALALVKKGHKVLAIDADPYSQGLWDWFGLAFHEWTCKGSPGGRFPFLVERWPTDTNLAQYAATMEQEFGASRVIIDCGGEHPGTLRRALVYSDQLVSPVGPMEAELRRMPATFDVAAEVAAGKPDGLDMAVLLTRVPQVGKGSAVYARQLLESDEERGFSVLRHEIQRRQEYADEYGRLVWDTRDYTAVVDELEVVNVGRA